jgi:hypothetical protein
MLIAWRTYTGQLSLGCMETSRVRKSAFSLDLHAIAQLVDEAAIRDAARSGDASSEWPW